MPGGNSDINYVIMDYLINEGYPAAAKKFATEANVQHFPSDTENIEQRVEIRNYILAGDIESAIEKINDLDAEVRFPLSTHAYLFGRSWGAARIRHCFMHHAYPP